MGSFGYTERVILYLKEVPLLTRVSFGTSWRTIRDPLRRSRLRWFMLGWIITIPTLFLGAGYAFAGKRIVIANGAYAVYARIPGGLHTHGAILMGLGLGLVMGLSAPLFGQPEPRTWLRWFLRLTGYYYAWSASLLALAPLVKGGQFSYVGFILWATFSLLPAVLLIGPPPTLVPRNETDLVRAAKAVGISSEKATELVQVYLHGGKDAD